MTAEELLYDLAESVRPGARGFHGMCPEMAAKIIRDEISGVTVTALRAEIEEYRDAVSQLEEPSNWTITYDGPSIGVGR